MTTVLMAAWLLLLGLQPSAAEPAKCAGEREAKKVDVNARLVVSWYHHFVEVRQNDDLNELPVRLPGTPEEAIFTAEEARAGAWKLPDEERQRVEDHVAKALQFRAEQDKFENRRLNLGQPPRPKARVYFVNPLPDFGNDVLSAVAALEASIFAIADGVEALTSYHMFREKGLEGIPAELEDVIAEEYERLKAGLPEEQRKRIAGWEVRAVTSPNTRGILWLSYSPSCKQIVISPMLARTIFMQVVRIHGRNVVDLYAGLLELGYMPDILKEGAKPPKSNDLRFYEALAILSQQSPWAVKIVEVFRGELRFMLAHEMAHVFLGERQEEYAHDEGACDRAALELVQRLGGDAQFGAFQSILARALEEGSLQLWGFEDLADAEKVLERIRNLTAKPPPERMETVTGDAAQPRPPPRRE
jgi:hypothetical protein